MRLGSRDHGAANGPRAQFQWPAGDDHRQADRGTSLIDTAIRRAPASSAINHDEYASGHDRGTHQNELLRCEESWPFSRPLKVAIGDVPMVLS